TEDCFENENNDKRTDITYGEYLQNFDESKTLLMTRRLNRIVVILKLLGDQFMIIETMTPHDFMEFRYRFEPELFSNLSANILKYVILKQTFVVEGNRVEYDQKNYKEALSDMSDIKRIEKSLQESSLLQLVEKWLERTPGLKQDFNFWEKYLTAVRNWIEESLHKPALVSKLRVITSLLVATVQPYEEKDQTKKRRKMTVYEKQMDAFDSIVTVDAYNECLIRGDRRLSYLAFQGALMIFLYHDEPRFHQPFQVLNLLMDIDSLMTKWRHNHLLMVHRMIGKKMGTGMSSGYQYLRATI
ncbi:hypothetical protein LSH36_7g21017, partial [Paralvinella palmiformis]